MTKQIMNGPSLLKNVSKDYHTLIIGERTFIALFDVIGLGIPTWS